MTKKVYFVGGIAFAVDEEKDIISYQQRGAAAEAKEVFERAIYLALSLNFLDGALSYDEGVEISSYTGMSGCVQHFALIPEEEDWEIDGKVYFSSRKRRVNLLYESMYGKCNSGLLLRRRELILWLLLLEKLTGKKAWEAVQEFPNYKVRERELVEPTFVGALLFEDSILGKVYLSPAGKKVVIEWPHPQRPTIAKLGTPLGIIAQGVDAEKLCESFNGLQNILTAEAVSEWQVRFDLSEDYIYAREIEGATPMSST